MWLKSLLYGLGKLLLATCLVALLFAGLVFAGVLFAASDKADAERFCAATPLGQPWAEVARHIAASKADQRQSTLSTSRDGAQSVGVTFHGLFPQSRHICNLTLRDGRVSARAHIFLD